MLHQNHCRLIGWYAWDKALLLPGDLLDCEDSVRRHYLSIIVQQQQGHVAKDGDERGPDTCELVVHYLGWAPRHDDLFDEVCQTRCYPPLHHTGPLPSRDDFICGNREMVLRGGVPDPDDACYPFFVGEVEALYYTAVSQACTRRQLFWQLRCR
jgi:hypothetical protein